MGMAVRIMSGAIEAIPNCFWEVKREEIVRRCLYFPNKLGLTIFNTNV